uniref:Uncharacterized protein n=1 Tax=viral metagenome TaxID=1070528 RepID=A0A6C0D235_9ZZZZ
MNSESISIPANFRSIIVDFTTDLSATFPEYAYLWSKWQNPALSENELGDLFRHCMTVYPERFFDVLNQNDEIFNSEALANTMFLPNVDFKLLYNCDGVSENTKKTLWKYIQLILFTIVGGIQDKTSFGEAMNMFEGIDETMLQDKLKETMEGISSFFSKEESQEQSQDSEETPKSNPFTDLPNFENMQDHLKTLFDGKIGTLAQEMAEEIQGEFTDLLGEDMKDIKNTDDVLKKLMKNPKKIMDLVKTVGGKLDSKMKSGEISKEELMKEATDMMKNMGGMDKFGDMFKEMAKNIGGMQGMGGMGKNMRVDVNAMNRMTKQQEMKEKMLAKLRAKQEAQAKFSVQPTDATNNFVFKIDGEENQEKSYIHPDILKEMELEDAKKANPTKKSSEGNKKKKGKKGK